MAEHYARYCFRCQSNKKVRTGCKIIRGHFICDGCVKPSPTESQATLLGNSAAHTARRAGSIPAVAANP